jgi:hypothetical protein
MNYCGRKEGNCKVFFPIQNLGLNINFRKGSDKLFYFTDWDLFMTQPKIKFVVCPSVCPIFKIQQNIGVCKKKK